MAITPNIRRLTASDSYTFLMKELERVDPKILEPLSGTDWPRDMPVITGGGLIESIATIDVTYASTSSIMNFNLRPTWYDASLPVFAS